MKTMAEALAAPGTVRWNEVFPHGNCCGAFFHILRGCIFKAFEVNEEICAACEDFVPLMDDVGRSRAWKDFISRGGDKGAKVRSIGVDCSIQSQSLLDTDRACY